MRDAGLLLDAKAQSALLEYPQHRDVVCQYLCDQLFDAGLTGKHGQMVHEQCADALALVMIDSQRSPAGHEAKSVCDAVW